LKKNNIIISVIIPTYNDGKYLKYAIESIQNQTYKNIEIIVVDDFSTDNTKQIVSSIAKSDDRVKYYLNDFKDSKKFDKNGININAGYSARNFGLNKATGEWITFQDGDDISFLNRLEIQLELVKKYKVSHLNTQVVWLKDKFIGKLLDIESFSYEFGIEKKIVTSEEIYSRSKKGIGFFAKLLPEKLWCRIPFEFKRKRFINKLFFGHEDSYIGAAGPVFFKKNLLKKVQFRQLDYRIWPSLKGRGADRDFNYNLAYTFNDSLFVDVPLYCWRTPTKFEDKYNIDRFLK